MMKIKWVPLVNQYNFCCCSCTLRTGIMLIAWLGLFVEITQVMDATFRLHYCKEKLAAANLQAVRLQEISNIAELETEVTAGPMIEGDADLGTGNHVIEAEDVGSLEEFNVGSIEVCQEILTTRLVVGIFDFLVEGCLLYGVWKEKAQFIVPYILLQFIFLCIYVVGAVLGTIFLLFYSPLAAILFLIIFGVLILLTAYLWAGVCTYYRQLTEPDQLHQGGQLQNLAKVKLEEKEEIINPEEIQEAYAKIEYNIQQNQSYEDQKLM